MTIRFTAPKLLLIALMLALSAMHSDAQSQSLDSIKSQQDLDKVMAALDTALFDAYNRCDLPKFQNFLADDVEFYHDQGGVTLGKENLTASIKNNICGGDVMRELVPGTLEAHYMKGYGAVQIGVHRFLRPDTR